MQRERPRTVPAREFGRRTDHRRKPRLGVVLDLRAGLETVEHENAGLAAERRPRPRALLDMGDEEDAASRLEQGGRGDFDAEAVGVGLDHRAAGGRRGFAREPAPIVAQGFEVDGQAPGRRHRQAPFAALARLC